MARVEFEAPAICLVEASSTLSILHYAEDVVGIYDQVFFALDLYLRTGIFGQDHHVPGAHLQLVGGPTATTSAVCGFSLAVSGRTIPLAVCSSPSTILTSALAPSGFNFIYLHLLLCGFDGPTQR